MNIRAFIIFGVVLVSTGHSAVGLEFVSLKSDYQLVYGSPTKIKCELSTPDAEVWWTLHGVNISSESDPDEFKFHHSDGDTLWTLEIVSPVPQNSGELGCHAALPGKPETEKSRTIILKVFEFVKKVVIHTPPVLVAKPNGRVVLKCLIKLEGEPGPYLIMDSYWTKDGKQSRHDLTITNSSNHFEARLTIPSFGQQESGVYTCHVTTFPTPSISSTVVVTTDMLAPYRVNAQILNSSASPSVLLSWLPPQLPGSLRISTYRVVIKTGNQTFERTVQGSEDNVHNDHELFIWNELMEGQLYTFRVYSCVRPETCGDPSEPLTIAVFEDFARPENVTVMCRYDNVSFESFIDVEWDPPRDAQDYPLSYQVTVTSLATYRDSHGEMRQDHETSVYRSPRTSWRHLVKSNTNYTVQVCVATIYGCGQASVLGVNSSCLTPRSVPPQLPSFELHELPMSTDWVNLKLALERISERYGPIKCYRIVVYKLRSGLGIENSRNVILSTYQRVHEKGNYGAYVAEAFNSEMFQSEVVLGDERQSLCEDDASEVTTAVAYRRRRRDTVAETATMLVPMEEETETTDTPVADEEVEEEVEEKKEESVTADPHNVVFDGRLDPDTVYSGFVEVSVVGQDGKILTRRSPMFKPIKTNGNTNNGVVVLPTALGVICGLVIIILILTVALCILRRKSVNHGQAGVPILPQPNTKPIKKEDLMSAYVQRHKDSDLLFQREYELLPEYFNDRSTRSSDMVENFCKNRYPDIKAYDQSRVKLSVVAGQAGSDYINANYVQGYNKKKFICAQGPLDKTVNDFWRMIWEQKVEVIAMVTGLEENGKTKCSKYWPNEGEAEYGDVSVRTTEEVVYGEYAVRRFLVKGPSSGSVGESESRAVVQFHYLVWKDFLAPDHPGGILKFNKRIREVTGAASRGQLLVHCSAGVGRTGTLVAIDSLIEQMEAEGHIDVYHFVASIRRHRNFLVQSLTQYIFIYRALMEYAQFPDTEIEIQNLQTCLANLELCQQGEKSTLAKEFEMLDDVLEDYKTTDIGNMDVNMNKNRYDFIVPFDRNRVVLTPVMTLEHATYINASFIQGYDRSASYIITQDPLVHTIEEFWRMIHEHCVPVIVMLSQLGEEKDHCPKYWPDDEQLHKHINVKLQETTEDDHFTTRKLLVTNTKTSKSHTVTHFQFKDWVGEVGATPENSAGLLSLIHHSNAMMDNDSSKEPITIHCSGGGDRSSVFAALSILVHQAVAEKRIDVFHVVCNLRTQRKFMIQALDQYRFCYRAIMDYVRSHNLDK